MLLIKYMCLRVRVSDSPVIMLTLQYSYFPNNVVIFQVFTFVDTRTKFGEKIVFNKTVAAKNVL